MGGRRRGRGGPPARPGRRARLAVTDRTPVPAGDPQVNRRLLVDAGKYLLAAGLLAWVVRSNWSPPPTRAVAVLAASTVGMCTSHGSAGPLLAATAALPGRAEPRGLGQVWRRHVLE